MRQLPAPRQRGLHLWHHSSMKKPNVFRPVGPGEDWRLNAVIQYRDDHTVALGFAENADLIVRHWLTDGPNGLLFDPLVYTHRHALELILKGCGPKDCGMLAGRRFCGSEARQEISR